MSHTSMYLYLDPLRVKVGEGDLHGYIFVIFVINNNNNNFFFLFFTLRGA